MRCVFGLTTIYAKRHTVNKQMLTDLRTIYCCIWYFITNQYIKNDRVAFPLKRQTFLSLFLEYNLY